MARGTIARERAERKRLDREAALKIARKRMKKAKTQKERVKAIREYQKVFRRA